MILLVAKKIKHRLHCREKNVITCHWDGLPAEEQTTKFTRNQVSRSVLGGALIILPLVSPRTMMGLLHRIAAILVMPLDNNQQRVAFRSNGWGVKDT